MTGVWGVRWRAVRGMVGLVSGELGGACAPRRVCGGPGRVALGAAVSPEKTFSFGSHAVNGAWVLTRRTHVLLSKHGS